MPEALLVLWLPEVKSQLIGKDPDDGKDRGQRGRGRQRRIWLDSFTDSMDMKLSKFRETGKPGVLQSMESAKSWTYLGNRIAAT